MLLFTLSVFPLPNAIAGLPKDDIAQWQLIKDEFFIDTNNFKVTKTNINFWIREKNYSMRRLSINCNNLTESESYRGKNTPKYPISPKTIKHEIVNQLCFLTEVEGFNSERRKPSWAKRIILIDKKNKEIIEEKKKEKMNVLNEPINETKIDETTENNSKVKIKKKFKLNNLFRFLNNP